MSEVIIHGYDSTGNAWLPVKVDSSGRLAIDVETVTLSNVEISNDVGNPIPIIGTQIGEVEGSPTANTVLDRLKTIAGKIPSLGSATAANSLPVTIASDQAVVPVIGSLVTVSATLTRPADTTAYAANDIVSNSTSSTTLITLASVVRANGGSAYIIGIRISTNKKSITPRFRVHFFNASDPTVSADNVACKAMYADNAKRLGYYDMPAMSTEADTTNSDMSRAIDFTMRIPVVAGASTTSIYAMLETLDAFTPASGQEFTLLITVDRN